MSKKVSPQKKKPVSKEQEVKQSLQKVQKQKQKDKQKQIEEAHERVKILETSGILDAYEYLLRQVCKNGLPDTNIFEFAAQQILKYEKKMKLNHQKRQQLLNLSKVESNQKDNYRLVSGEKKAYFTKEDKSKQKEKMLK